MARGVGLFGVVKGFARSVLGLGRVMSGAMDRLEGEGAEPMSANAGYDFPRVMELLRRAVHMADALKARLLTPVVAEFIAMARFRAARTHAGTNIRISARDERPKVAEPACLGDIMFQINFTRSDPATRQQLRQAIADMSDREVVTYIYADLREASEMLGETKLAAQVEAMACKASALLDAAEAAAGAAAAAEEALDDAMLDRAMTWLASHGTPDEDLDEDFDEDLDEDLDPEPTPLVRPSWRTVGRGPP
jgi:hypothetical protein